MRPSGIDRKSTRLNSSHLVISYAVFCLKKKKKKKQKPELYQRITSTLTVSHSVTPRHLLAYYFCPLLTLSCLFRICFFFFFNDTATTEIYTLSLHDALPISQSHIHQQLQLSTNLPEPAIYQRLDARCCIHVVEARPEEPTSDSSHLVTP